MSTQAPSGPTPRITATSLRGMKAASAPVVMLTAYDYHSARLVDAAGVDAVLVGDSLGMTMLGHESTLSVTVDDVLRATSAVSRAVSHALVIADMPFMSYQADYAEGMRNAGRMLSEGGAQAVKLEGATFDTIALVEGLVSAGVPVMGHVGLTPQSINVLGGYATQGKGAPAAAKVIADAVALDAAGAFAIVLECVPVELAERITSLVTVPTIGIGAGVGCDGQVQVFHDVLGLGDFVPRHAKRYAELDAEIGRAVTAYAEEVRTKTFPAEEQSTHMDNFVLAEAEILFSAEYADEYDEDLL